MLSIWHSVDDTLSVQLVLSGMVSNWFEPSVVALKIFYFFDINGFYTAIFEFPIVIVGLKDSGLTAHIFYGTSGFYKFKNGNDLVLVKSDLTHGDLLRGYNHYVRRSLCNG